jgi:hypothetical protein
VHALAVGIAGRTYKPLLTVVFLSSFFLFLLIKLLLGTPNTMLYLARQRAEILIVVLGDIFEGDFAYTCDRNCCSCL